MTYGLMGKNLSHSLSGEIHRMISGIDYELFDIEEKDIESLIKSREISGLNVTMPYKNTVIKYLDRISPRAEKTGAVNTIYKKDGKILGDNTDYLGFSYIFDGLNADLKESFALIIGDGATSMTISSFLEERKIRYFKLSRKNPPYIKDMKDYDEAGLIINATPVGMYPYCGESLVDLSLFDSLKGVIDVIYNPLKSKFILDAEKRSIPFINGLPMLVKQAVLSEERFLDKKFPKSLTGEILNELIKREKNIVLIGMPGSGKSSLGKKLAEKLERKYIDLDYEIEKLEGKSPQDIIRDEGENYFRNIEEDQAKIWGREKGLVIACGGGIVEREDNYYSLRQNSRVYLIDRELDKLQIGGRPISEKYGIEELFKRREEKYLRFSDCQIKNDRLDLAMGRIIEDYEKNFADQWP